MIILTRFFKLVLFFGLWFAFYLLVAFIGMLIDNSNDLLFSHPLVLFISAFGFLPAGNIVWGD